MKKRKQKLNKFNIKTLDTYGLSLTFSSGPDTIEQARKVNQVCQSIFEVTKKKVMKNTLIAGIIDLKVRKK